MKKLLFSLMIAGVSAVTFNAQVDKIWDFNDKTAFPSTSAAMSTTTVIDHLTFVPGSSFGAFNSQGGTFADGYTPTQRVATGGHSYSSSTYDPAASGNSPVPTQRFLSFKVTGNSTIKVWARGGGSGRSVIITDGVSVLGRSDFSGNTNTVADCLVAEATYTGPATTIYVANAFNANSLFKVEATSVDTSTMAVGDVKYGVKATAFTSGNRIYVSNLESKNTNISVYNANGSLVKSLKSSVDTNFEISTKGLYIVNIKSEAGEKSVKVLVK